MSDRIIIGDARHALAALPDESIQCCVTSPPYWGLRDYGHVDQVGLEPTPDEYVANMVAVFREVRRVLRDDGTLWLNIGDSYATGAGKVGGSPGGGRQGANWKGPVTSPNRMPIDGMKPKDLVGIPWVRRTGRPCGACGELIPTQGKSCPRCGHVNDWKANRQPSAAMCADGWSAVGRHVPRALTSSGKDATVGSSKTVEDGWGESCDCGAGHPVPCTVLDPFFGAGTVGLVAHRLGRAFVGIELNPAYAKMAEERIAADVPLFSRIRLVSP